MMLALISLALALPDYPAPAPIGEHECEPVSIRAGYPIPESLLVMGVANCNAEVVPQSEMVTLYEVESWSKLVKKEYALDIAALDLEIAHYKGITEKEMPWRDKPETQRWMGRLDVIVPVAVGLITAAVVLGAK